MTTWYCRNSSSTEETNALRYNRHWSESVSHPEGVQFVVVSYAAETHLVMAPSLQEYAYIWYAVYLKNNAYSPHRVHVL